MGSRPEEGEIKPTARRTWRARGSRRGRRRRSKVSAWTERWAGKALEAFLRLPVPVVLAVLWLAGLLLLGAGALALYIFGSTLARMLLGP